MNLYPPDESESDGASLIQRLKLTYNICINGPNRRTETQVAVLGYARVSTEDRITDRQFVHVPAHQFNDAIGNVFLHQEHA